MTFLAAGVLSRLAGDAPERHAQLFQRRPSIVGHEPGLTHKIAQVAQLDLASLSWLRKRPRVERKRLLSS